MIEEKFTDRERTLLVVLVQKALLELKADPVLAAARGGGDHMIAEVRTVLGRLSGTDTVLIAQRAYSSHRDDDAA
jgi:hypothetical protein